MRSSQSKAENTQVKLEESGICSDNLDGGIEDNFETSPERSLNVRRKCTNDKASFLIIVIARIQFQKRSVSTTFLY